MRIALGRIAGTIPRVCLHPGDARRQNTAVPSSSTFLFPWCPLQGARECPDRDFRERHFGLCTSFREAAGRGCRKKKTKKRAVAILLIQSTSAVINKAHLSAPRCHGPPALFKSRFPCFAQPFHAAATPRSIPQNHQHPPKMMSVCVTPLHKAMGSHQDLLQHSPATKTSVLSPRRAGYPQQPSCSPGMSIPAAKATTSLCFSLLHQTILRLGLLENTNSGTSRRRFALWT